MSAREDILARLRGVAVEDKAMPELSSIESIRFEGKVAHFTEMVKAVGGEVVEMAESLEQTLAECGVDCANLVSPLAELSQAVNPDAVEDVHDLGGDYTSVVRGKIGVAENGAVWVPVEGNRKAHLFACKHLVIVLDKSAIVDTMHDAVAHPSFEAVGYGAFISGPSKTADIEQALVMGAHGAMRATIILH
jgi:L-lactate dehydrogenase complex protein LldG